MSLKTHDVYDIKDKLHMMLCYAKQENNIYL